ncbi:MAG: NADP-dependent isocitrate dehydrogenase [Chloroherpetonaceae bacterium]|nr:NADP-dependent isocitrate dehydrogenase [Chthonomonadaceae bacterium]MDW8208066.1 NADP-dependent isocitrate dehydrogenase [Chloroherpetonaceae bacterium]
MEATPGDVRPITVIAGDGIGPEVVRAAMRVVEASGARVCWEECEAGARVFQKGLATGVPPETIESIRRTRVVLKGPLETPVGYGEKSANVTLRKLFETYGNIRPARELPGVVTPFHGRGVDLVVIRENVEDLYAGIEHLQTPGVAQCLKLMSQVGCEKIVRLAFEFARADGRRSVHCATKANIMKLTEGLLQRTFERIAPEYPDITAKHILIDNCAHQLVRHPEQFEVIVTSNMNGDILSDLTSGLIGGLGLAPSANIGNEVAMFEAVHGSAPDIAGRNVANPTAMILSAVLMLRHIGAFDAAARIKRAVLLTLEQGVHTADIAAPGHRAVSTTEFADAVIGNLGKESPNWHMREWRPLRLPDASSLRQPALPTHRRVIGADVFVEWRGTAEALGGQLEALVEGTPLRLKMVSNRGTRVYPPTGALTDCVDHWRCRFVLRSVEGTLEDALLLSLLQRLSAQLRWMHVEKLQEFDGEPAFTRAQGED